MSKIEVDRLSRVADYLLEQGGTISATQIAKEINVTLPALWKNLRVRGIESSRARELASALDREATKLRDAARDLRAAARGD